jgi:hypothetical protein
VTSPSNIKAWNTMHRLDQIHDERGDRIAVAQAVADVVS